MEHDFSVRSTGKFPEKKGIPPEEVVPFSRWKLPNGNCVPFTDFSSLSPVPCLSRSFKRPSEVSTTVNQERREDTDVSLLIIPYADNKHLFGGKVTKKDVFEKTAEQFIKASGRLVKRQRMGLMTNGTHTLQWKFSESFCKWKTPSE